MDAMNRRGFLGRAAAAAAAPLLLPSWSRGQGAPSNRITAAIIGMGDRGRQHLGALRSLPEAQVVAVCDVFRSKAESAQRGLGASCTAHQDFREIIARPDVDAVFITAPEHWHAVMAIAAMNAGKDVYCEKALSLTVAEGRAVCDAVRRTGRVFQAGTQQRSDGNFRLACELARNGYLGRLQRVVVAVPAGPRPPLLPVEAPPADLDYELWLGPSPLKPHRRGLCTYNWYFVTDYCAGWIQSWGVHHMDIALWGAPQLMASTLTVEGTATFPESGTADVAFGWQTRMTTPDGLSLEFHDDRSGPFGHGVRFIGDRGWVHVVRGGIKAEPASLLQTLLRPGQTRLPRSTHHVDDFLQAMRSRRDPIAPVEGVHAATTGTLIADIANRCGRKLTWDWAAERFVGDDMANRMLTRTLRNPWTV